MATRTRFLTTVLTGIFAAMGTALPAAALDFDIAANLKLSDDVQLFVNLSNDHYHPDPDVAVVVLKKVPNPGDDFPVLLFLAAESGRGIDELWSLRVKGMSWSAILLHIGVHPSRLFVGMDRDPGPPYGNAWGHYRKRGGAKVADFTLTDNDFVSLVKIQITSSHFDSDPNDVLREHRGGKKFERIASEKHKARGGQKHAQPTGKTSSPGKGKGNKKK
jgi:hypothetical protein